jgi:hypothetical protein
MPSLFAARLVTAKIDNVTKALLAAIAIGLWINATSHLRFVKSAKARTVL